VIHPSVQAPPIRDGLQFMLARVVVHETGPGSKVVHRLEDVRDVHVSSPGNHLASTGRGLRVGARLLRFRAIRAPVGYPRGMDLGHLAILAGSGPTMFTKQVSRPGVRSGSPTVAARRSMSSETRRKTGHGPMRGSCAPSRFALPRARPCVSSLSHGPAGSHPPRAAVGERPRH
jgi:hypothetical protein